MGKKIEPLIGFLTVIELRESVLIGGYLILNAQGRPVEFHCTAPVQPNRAQQILYGASLRPYLCGERIGQALVQQSRQKPELLCVDVVDAVGLRDRASMPVILLPNETSSDTNGTNESVTVSDMLRIQLGMTTAHIHAADADRRNAIETQWNQFERVDLIEPFGRIYEAIREAQKDAAA